VLAALFEAVAEATVMAPTSARWPHVWDGSSWKFRATGTARSLRSSSTGTSARDGRVRLEALVLALMQVVVQGVSTRRVKKITERLCGRRFSKSTVSELSKGLEVQVEVWAKRPLGECPFLICDGIQVRVRRQGAVHSTTVLLIVAVTSEGQREIRF
jgi:hypothetical protein